MPSATVEAPITGVPRTLKGVQRIAAAFLYQTHCAKAYGAAPWAGDKARVSVTVDGDHLEAITLTLDTGQAGFDDIFNTIIEPVIVDYGLTVNEHTKVNVDHFTA
jgi:hypothetical protein